MGGMGAISHCKRSLPYDMKFSRDLIFLGVYFDDFARPFHSLFQVLTSTTYCSVACENSRFSLLFATVDVSRGGTSATKRQKFHTDDVNQCLHNKFGSYGVPNTICSILRLSWSILVKCLGFCTLCFCFPTKMLHLNAPFFPLKCSVSSKKSLKCSDKAHYTNVFLN